MKTTTKAQYLRLVKKANRLFIASKFDTVAAAQYDALNIRIRELQMPCPGNAHSAEVGGMQDNCTICMPNWGVVFKEA